jgi:hypothetical protein
VLEEREDVEETTTSPSEPYKSNAEPELALLGLAASERDLQTDDESQEMESQGEGDMVTHTRVIATNFVHSQTHSGNEVLTSASDPSE